MQMLIDYEVSDQETWTKVGIDEYGQVHLVIGKIKIQFHDIEDYKKFLKDISIDNSHV